MRVFTRVTRASCGLAACESEPARAAAPPMCMWGVWEGAGGALARWHTRARSARGGRGRALLWWRGARAFEVRRARRAPRGDAAARCAPRCHARPADIADGGAVPGSARMRPRRAPRSSPRAALALALALVGSGAALAGAEDLPASGPVPADDGEPDATTPDSSSGGGTGVDVPDSGTGGADCTGTPTECATDGLACAACLNDCGLAAPEVTSQDGSATFVVADIDSCIVSEGYPNGCCELCSVCVDPCERCTTSCEEAQSEASASTDYLADIIAGLPPELAGILPGGDSSFVLPSCEELCCVVCAPDPTQCSPTQVEGDPCAACEESCEAIPELVLPELPPGVDDSFQLDIPDPRESCFEGCCVVCPDREGCASPCDQCKGNCDALSSLGGTAVEECVQGCCTVCPDIACDLCQPCMFACEDAPLCLPFVDCCKLCDTC